MKKLRVAIAGATGYTGLELFKLLNRHPRVDLVALTSEQSSGKTLASQFPQLLSEIEKKSESRLGQSVKETQSPALMPLCKLDELQPQDLDSIFFCLPHRGAADWVADNAAGNAAGNAAALPQIIDLSADFRLKNPLDYEKWYGFKHPAPDLLASALYGLTEFNRAALTAGSDGHFGAGAKIIANPGCYPTCTLLGVLPLLKAGVIAENTPIIIDAKSGVSGAGRKAALSNSFVEANENCTPYGLGNSHRHVPEIEQELALRGTSGGPEFVFSPHLLPISRGMIASLYLRLNDGFSEENARTILEETYSNALFVRILPAGETTSVNHVARTNFCALSLHGTGKNLIVISAIDNLLKGASGQAIQNFNVSHGFPETEGFS